MVAIKRILCPIDFSECSRHALDRAAAIAKAHGACITALHVVPVQPRYTPFPLEIVTSTAFELTLDQRESLRRKMVEFAMLAPSTAVPMDVEVADALAVDAEIVAQAARLGVDLIVMGTHGRSGFRRLLLGSVTERVLRTAVQPVLTAGAADSTARGGSFRRILSGVDFSECSLAALRYALTLAEGADAKVTAVNVIEWVPAGCDPLIGPPTDLVGYRMAAEAGSRDRLMKALARAKPKNVRVDEVVVTGKAHHEILRIARELESDLIVLGIHGRNPIDRLFFGSTAEPVVRRAACPVLTVRAEFGAAAAAA